MANKVVPVPDVGYLTGWKGHLHCWFGRSCMEGDKLWLAATGCICARLQSSCNSILEHQIVQCYAIRPLVPHSVPQNL
jgi:hypothetical protein